jgi:acyl-CoA synthetase (AMP-forming)/AMP-acid ligase II/acyl carrier protein
MSIVHELARVHADRDPDAVLYEHLLDGEQHAQQLTAGQLWKGAGAVAAALRELGPVGQRVLLLYPPGLDFVQALVGTWLAGAVAVPAPAPGPHASERIRDRLVGMAHSSGASLVLAPGAVLGQLGALGGALAELPTLASDGLAAGSVPSGEGSRETLAYLQYTSGSTADPRGVAITHGNLLQNCADVQEAYAFDAASRLVSWVPTHHDLGLVYAVVMPLYVGFRAVTFSPEAFVQRPIRWLRALSSHRGTHSVAPNFGFDLAVVRTTPEERQGLDLSAWRVALNGAEPIRRATEDRFAATYAPHGFRKEALSHSYGLAEATAKVTAERSDRRGVFVTLSAAALEQGLVRPPSGDERAVEIAGCGVPASGMQVQVVEPETGTALPEGKVGEIRLAGGSVATGYWDNPQATGEIFGGGWLRTGDLGFLREGQLFVTGRIKDLIVVRGENHYPQDLEWAVQGRHEALRPACAAAFGVDRGDREQVVLVTDVYPDKVGDGRAVMQAIREGVAEHGLSVDVIVLVPPQTVPKTSSGKVQRRATRQRWLAGQLPVIASWEQPAPATSSPAPALPIDEALRQAAASERTALLEAHLCRLVAERLGLDAVDVSPTASLKALGVDSIAAVELGERLSQDLRMSLYPGVVQDHATVREVAAFVSRQRR